MILHICSEKAWEEAKVSGFYEAESLKSQGFIHCSKAEQIVKVANFNFRNQKDLILLLIDDKKVIPEIKYEDGGSGELYPHIYGQLNLDAVLSTTKFPCNPDGNFSLPDLNLSN